MIIFNDELNDELSTLSDSRKSILDRTISEFDELLDSLIYVPLEKEKKFYIIGLVHVDCLDRAKRLKIIFNDIIIIYLCEYINDKAEKTKKQC
jgi:hypothetical protein